MPNSGLSRRKRRSQIPGFTPAKLFASSEAGVWYDPSDLTPEKVSWRRNLLTRTEEFDNAAWNKVRASVTANSVASPDGTQTADTLIEDTSASTNHYCDQDISVTAGVSYTVSVYAKTFGRNFQILFAPSGWGSNKSATFNLTAGTASALSGVTASVVDAGNGWFRCIATCVATATATTKFYFVLADGTNTSYTGNGTSGAYFWGAQFEVATTASAYQRITDFTSDFLAAFPTHTLYQNSTGTTPVTALGQSVGLVLDKSQGGLAALSSDFVVNGDFSSSAGWTVGAGWSIAGGVATGASASTDLFRNFNVFTSGRTYRVDVSVLTVTGGSFRVWIGGTFGPVVSTVGNQTFYITSGASVQYFSILGSSFSGTIDSIAIREVPGNHARQTTDAARPTLQARSNLLTYSEQADNAAWVKTQSTITANAAIAPDGTTTGDQLIENTANAQHFVGQAPSLIAGTYTFSVYYKLAAGTRNLALYHAGANVGRQFDGSGNSSAGVFNAPTAFAVTDAGNGWYRASITVAISTGASEWRLWLSTSANALTYTGDGASGYFLWGGQVELGSTASTYQRVVTATDYADVGGPRSLTFDGVDDSLVTAGNVNFSGTDKMTVCAGVFKGSDAALGIVAELSASLGAGNPGSFFVTAPRTAATGDFAFNCGGTAFGTGAISANAFPAPIVCVATGVGDISGDVTTLRLNGTQAATSSTDQGTGNFGNYQLFIGRRNQATLPFNGRIHQLIVRGAATDSVTVQQTERFVAQKTGVTL